MPPLPRDATEILQRLTKGSFEVHLNHRRLEATVNRLVMGVLTAALFVGSTSMLSSRVPPVFHDVSIVGALGCVFAVGLGFTLVRSIRQSTGNDRR